MPSARACFSVPHPRLPTSRKSPPPGDWQLYDLSSDPGEVVDRAAEHPEIVDELANAWEGYARDNGVIKPGEPVAYGRPVSPGKF